MSNKKPSEEILRGRRTLDGLAGYSRLEDLVWDLKSKKWKLKFQLSSKGSELIPQQTDWVMLISDKYPWGSIKIHPSAVNSITTTFPHMSFNGDPEAGNDWRTATLCLDTTVMAIERRDVNAEVFTALGRLKWHIVRALHWLDLACEGKLLDVGQPFELPVFERAVNDKRIYITAESTESFTQWAPGPHKSGVFEAIYFRTNRAIIDPRIVVQFFSSDGKKLFKPSWGNVIAACERHWTAFRKRRRDVRAEIGVWFLLPNFPIKEAWQMPKSWNELLIACNAIGFPIEDEFKKVLPYLRDDLDHVALIGIPIPVNVGEASRQLVWQAVDLPAFDSHTLPNGFRGGPIHDFYRNRFDLTKLKNAKVTYPTSQNWHKSEISNRGQYSDKALESKIAILGAGAFGSLLAEQLARNGINDLFIVDPDCLEVGNLTRHSLGIGEIGLPKALSVASSLEHVSPHQKAKGVFSAFPFLKHTDREILLNNDVIIDCTASDEVLPELEAFEWKSSKLFFSFSLGLNGERMFCYSVKQEKFIKEDFRSKLRPWLIFEKEEIGVNHPREGTGCWSTVFPARIDDLQLFVSIAVKFIEERIVSGEEDSYLRVYEQQKDSTGFIGVRRVDRVPS